MTDLNKQRLLDRARIVVLTADSDLSSSRRTINENFKILNEALIELKSTTTINKLSFPTTYTVGDLMLLRAERDGKFAVVKSSVGIGTKYRFSGETITIPKDHQYIVTKVELLSGSQIIQEPGGELIVLENEVASNLKVKEIEELTTTSKTVVGAINELKSAIGTQAPGGGGGTPGGGNQSSGGGEGSVKGNNFKKQ